MPYLRRYLTILYFSMSVVPSVSRFYLSGVTFCQEQTFICQKDVLLSSLTKCYGLHFLNLRAWRPLISLFLCLKLTFHTLSFTAQLQDAPAPSCSVSFFPVLRALPTHLFLASPSPFPPFNVSILFFPSFLSLFSIHPLFLHCFHWGFSHVYLF